MAVSGSTHHNRGGAGGLPPAYLTVPQHRDCLGSHKRGSAQILCRLNEKPDGCPQESFDKLVEVFVGEMCDTQEEINWGKLGGAGGLPPAYLSVPHYKDCLGSQMQGSSSRFCKLMVKPEACPQESFDRLKDAFEGSHCTIQDLEKSS